MASPMRIPRTVLMAPVMGLAWFSVAWADINDGLLVYFPFDAKPVAGIVADESGHGNDGTIIGTPTYEPDGVSGGAYRFTAKSGSVCCSWYRDYITLKSNPTANVKELAVSLWIKTDTPGNNYKIASAASWPPGSGWVLGTHYPEIWGSSGNAVFKDCSAKNPIFESGKWNHIVISYNGTSFQQYVNGELVNNCSASGEKVGGARGQKLAIAAWPEHGFGYDGLIDDFRVYNRGVLAAEVWELYNRNITQQYITDFGEVRYELLVFDRQVSWFDAKKVCKSRQSELAEVFSQAGNDALVSLLSQANWGSFPLKGGWFSWRNATGQGNWGWDSGKPVSYTNWGIGEPNYADNCGAIELRRGSNGDGWWNNAPCGGNASHYPAVLCERDEDSVNLAEFKAEKSSDGVTITWTTSREENNALFRVWRSESLEGKCPKDYTKYTKADLLTEKAAKGEQGGFYSYLDNNGNKDYCYGLQDIDLDGSWNIQIIPVD